MKIKVSEAIGGQLDRLVAKALITGTNDDLAFGWDVEAGKVAWIPYSSQWGNGGPIIDLELIDVFHIERAPPVWEAEIQTGPMKRVRGRASTPLVAAMRCYVTSKLGNEVDVPEELA